MPRHIVAITAEQFGEGFIESSVKGDREYTTTREDARCYGKPMATIIAYRIRRQTGDNARVESMPRESHFWDRMLTHS
jgi:hypothetical protein